MDIDTNVPRPTDLVGRLNASGHMWAIEQLVTNVASPPERTDWVVVAQDALQLIQSWEIKATFSEVYNLIVQLAIRLKEWDVRERKPAHRAMVVQIIVVGN